MKTTEKPKKERKPLYDRLKPEVSLPRRKGFWILDYAGWSKGPGESSSRKRKGVL
jgi:hypothetical protein